MFDKIIKTSQICKIIQKTSFETEIWLIIKINYRYAKIKKKCQRKCAFSVVIIQDIHNIKIKKKTLLFGNQILEMKIIV